MKSVGFDVVIAGGGFAGLATAAALAQIGAEVCVLEPHHEPSDQLRGELLHARGVRSLEALGLIEAVEEEQPVRVHGFAAYAPHSQQPVILPYSKGNGIGIEHRALVSALRRKVAAFPNVKLMLGCKAVDVLRRGGRAVGVRGDNGEDYYAPLVIPADGRHSKLRKCLGIPTSVELLSHTVATTLRGHPLPAPNHGHVFVGAVGPILAYPFGADAVRVQLDVSIRAAKESGGLLPYLQRAYLPFVVESLRRPLEEAIRQRPLLAAANHAIYTEVCVAPGAALVGDAAGCSHPLTATGMTLALWDAEHLAQTVGAHGLTDRALLAYQRERNAFARARETFAHALYEVFRAEEEGANMLRSAVFDYWRSPRSRRASMDILSGEESTMRTFVAEYLRVVSLAAKGHSSGGSPIEPLIELAISAGRSMSFATDRILTRLTHDRMRKLQPFPIDGSSPPRSTKKKASAASLNLRSLLREHARPSSRRPTAQLDS